MKLYLVELSDSADGVHFAKVVRAAGPRAAAAALAGVLVTAGGLPDPGDRYDARVCLVADAGEPGVLGERQAATYRLVNRGGKGLVERPNPDRVGRTDRPPHRTPSPAPGVYSGRVREGMRVRVEQFGRAWVATVTGTARKGGQRVVLLDDNTWAYALNVVEVVRGDEAKPA